jgi:hypothetical protein
LSSVVSSVASLVSLVSLPEVFDIGQVDLSIRLVLKRTAPLKSFHQEAMQTITPKHLSNKEMKLLGITNTTNTANTTIASKTSTINEQEEKNRIATASLSMTANTVQVENTSTTFGTSMEHSWTSVELGVLMHRCTTSSGLDVEVRHSQTKEMFTIYAFDPINPTIEYNLCLTEKEVKKGKQKKSFLFFELKYLTVLTYFIIFVVKFFRNR